MRSFIKYLLRRGWKLTVVAAAGDLSESYGGTGDRVALRLVSLPTARSKVLRECHRLSSTRDVPAGWLSAAWRMVSGLPPAERPSAALVSTPPHSIQALGVSLRRAWGLPVVADLRDDWITNHRQRWLTPWHRWMAARREADCVAYASRLLLNTAEVKRRFTERYPGKAKSMAVLTNGFDEEDFQDGRGDRPSRDVEPMMRVCYAGASYDGYMDRQLKRLALDLLATGQAGRWEIVSLGWPLGRGLGAVPTWRHLGKLPFAEAAGEMSAAGVLLLPMPPGEKEPSGTVAMKSYGYLRSGRPIVYLGEQGSTTELLQRFEGTYCLGRAGWEGLAAWLASRRLELSRGYARPGVEEFRFDRLTERLEEYIQRSIAEG